MSEEKFEELWHILTPHLPKEIDMANFLNWAVGKAQYDFYNSAEGETRGEALQTLRHINLPKDFNFEFGRK